VDLQFRSATFYLENLKDRAPKRRLCATFCLAAPVFNLDAGVLKMADTCGGNHCPILRRVSCDQDIGVLVGPALGPQRGPELGGPIPDRRHEPSFFLRRWSRAETRRLALGKNRAR